MILGSKNHLHNNYQDFQAFLELRSAATSTVIATIRAPSWSRRTARARSGGYLVCFDLIFAGS